MKKRRLTAVISATLLFTIFLLSGCVPIGREDRVEKVQDAVGKIQEKQEKRESFNERTPDPQADFYDTPLVGVANDYSYDDNWLMIPDKITKDVDTFYVYPTIVTNTLKDAPAIVDIDEPIMRIGAYDTYIKNATAFEESTNVFAPFYRQTNMAAVADLRGQELEDFHKQEQRTDIYAALDYYFEHYNEGRPFILAGHSQGSILLKIALEEYFRLHPEYYERMIAAYLVGFSVTKDDLKNYPHLRFAQGASDTGVIVSWNTEGPGNKDADNIVLEPDAISINPITWTLTAAYAPADACPGSRVDDMAGTLEGEVVQLRFDIREILYTKTTIEELVGRVIEDSFTEYHPGIADAQVDPERGVVICTTECVPFMKITNPDMPDVFGPESYHSSDYALYYDSIVENVEDRIDHWEDQHEEWEAKDD
ncbi:MAG: DUF3089 domain-containing protein [Lachnospiraceae bacterium]|nr:DUF3089 domain-containing protein [Lachnospiraceae bacterium]